MPRYLLGFSSFSRGRRVALNFFKDDRRGRTPLLILLKNWRRGVSCNAFSSKNEEEILFGRALRCIVTKIEVVGAKDGDPKHLMLTLEDIGYE